MPYRPPAPTAKLPPMGKERARRYARPHVTNVNEEKEKSIFWEHYREEIERQFPGAFAGALLPAVERMAGDAVRGATGMRETGRCVTDMKLIPWAYWVAANIGLRYATSLTPADSRPR